MKVIIRKKMWVMWSSNLAISGTSFFFFFFFKILFLLKELYFSMLYFEPFLRFLSKKMKVHAL
jgi:hypothetical protein